MKREELLYKNTYKKKVNKSIFRYKWIYDNFLENTTNKKVLEIGIGYGGISQFLKTDNQVVGVEISDSAIKMNKNLGIKTVKADLDNARLPFRDKSFDIIIFIGTIEHLNNPQNSINEVKRLIKKNGRIIISIPNPLTGHYQIYPGLYEYTSFKEFLKINGFKIIKFKNYGIRPPLYHIFMKNKAVESKVDNQADNFRLGKIVYNISNIFKNKPKRFGWSWIFELKYVGGEQYDRSIERCNKSY